MMKWRKQTVAALWAVSVAMTAGAWTDSRAEGEAAATVPMNAARAATRQGPTATIASSLFHPGVDGAAMPRQTHSPAFAPRNIECVRGRAAAFHPGDAPHRALADAAQALRYEHQLAEASRET